MAPFPLNPDGGVGPGCARHGAGGTPALPGGPPPITIAPSVGSQPNRFGWMIALIPELTIPWRPFPDISLQICFRRQV